MRKIAAILTFLSCIFFSCSRNNPDDSGQGENSPCTTRGYSELTEISVKLSGYADPDGDPSGVEFGFIYSTDKTPAPGNGTVILADDVISNRQFSAMAEGLLSNTAYFYRAFFRSGGTYTYGETKTFKTKEIKATVTTGPAKSITSSSASLTSSCSFTDNVLPSSRLISGIFYHVSDKVSDPEALIGTGLRVEADPRNAEAKLSDLKDGTVYYFMAGYSISGLTQPVYGKVNSFTASDSPAEVLHKCSETTIADEMIFSSSCSRTLTSVQQGFDYDPVDNTLYFFQLNRWYRNIIGWTKPEVTLSTEVAPHYMGLRCFSHGNNIIIERTPGGEIFVWAPNFGSRGDGSYGNPWIVSRMPLKETTTLSQDIKNTDPDENYYFGVSPCWPAIDFDEDLIAICTYKKVYVYRLSEIQALPKTTVRLPAKITYGGIMTSSSSSTTYDTGIPEFTGYPEIVARDVTKIKPLIEFDSTYSKRGLHWQTFCIDNGKAYFLNMGDVPESSIVKHDTYVEVYDLKTGKLLREKVRQEYIQDVGGLASRGYVESDYCYVEPEGIKVMGDTMYILYTCRGNKNLTTRRPVIFKLSSDI